MEELAGSLGDRQANLLIKMSPPAVTTQLIKSEGQKPVIEFNLDNSKTNQAFKEVTYFTKIKKNGRCAFIDKQRRRDM